MPQDVTFGYSIFGLSGTATMQMPMQLVEAEAEHCP
jgi:hypothetical protein